MKLILKEIMKERNITQLQLSEMTGIRQPTISDMVNNRKDTINKSHLESICKALNIQSFDDILKWD